MGKESKRFLWSLLGIVLLFFTVQNFGAVQMGFGMLLELILPLVYGCVIAFVLNLIVRQLERFLTFGPFRKRTFRRIVSIILSLVLLVVIVCMCLSSAGIFKKLRGAVKSSVQNQKAQTEGN